MDCQQCRNQMQAYYDKLLTSEEEKQMESHLKQCESCKSIYKEKYELKIGSVIYTALKRISLKGWVVFSLAVFASLIFFFTTGGAKKASEWWSTISVGEQESLEDIKKFGVGNTLNLTSENNGVKITISHVLADDIQTFVYYEIEDLIENRLLRMNYGNSFNITNENLVFKDRSNSYFDPMISIDDDVNSEGNILTGRIILPPIEEQEVELNVTINELLEVVETELDSNGIPEMPIEETLVNGEWSFDVPIKKDEIIEKSIDVQTTIENNEVVFNNLIIAPTATFLGYQFDYTGMNYFVFDSLVGEDGNYEMLPMTMFPEDHYNSMVEDNLVTEFAPFKTMYYSQPEELQVKLGRVEQFVEVNKEFPIDFKEDKSQTITFEDVELTIEDIEVGTHSSLTINMNDQRKFSNVNFNVISDPAHMMEGMEVLEGVFVDIDGNEYKLSEMSDFEYGLRNVQFFPSKYKINLDSGSEKIVKPTGIRIYSYQTTKYPEKLISLSLK